MNVFLSSDKYIKINKIQQVILSELIGMKSVL